MVSLGSRSLFRRRPYCVDCARFVSASNVKRHRARKVLGRGTASDDLRVLSVLSGTWSCSPDHRQRRSLRHAYGSGHAPRRRCFQTAFCMAWPGLAWPWLGPASGLASTHPAFLLFRNMSRRRPYRVECTGSLSTSEVKQHRARLVLGWGTAWEDLRVLSAFEERSPMSY